MSDWFCAKCILLDAEELRDRYGDQSPFPARRAITVWKGTALCGEHLVREESDE